MKNLQLKRLGLAMLLILISATFLNLTQRAGNIIIPESFPDSINIKNLTFYKIDRISYDIIHDVLGYDSLNVLIVYMAKEIFLPTGEMMYGYVTQNKHIDNTYMIVLSNLLREKDLLETLAHEFAHIEQHQSGKFHIVSDQYGVYVYNQEIVIISEVPYHFRKYEIDAETRGKEIITELNKLYK